MTFTGSLTRRTALLGLAGAGIALALLWFRGGDKGNALINPELQQTFEHRIVLSPSAVLEIRNANGEISIHAGTEADALVRVRRVVTVREVSRLRPGTWFGSAPLPPQTAREELLGLRAEPVVHGDRTVLETTRQPGNDRFNVVFHYDVRLPEGRGLLVRNGNGTVHLAGLTGDVDVRAENGTIRIDAVRGEVIARTLNGGIHAREIDGPLTAEAVNGPILLDAHTMDTIHPIQCRSQNGPIRVHVGDEASFEMNASTVNGRVLTRLRVAGERTGAALRNLAGSVGDGGPLFDLHTLNGSVYVNAR